MSQISERFDAAIQILVGDGPIKSRLCRAYAEHLEDLQHVDLKVPGMAEFGELHAALHRVKPVGGVDSVKASVQKMSPAEAKWHSRTIVRLYGEILAMERGSRSEGDPILSPATEAPPRFLKSRNR